MKVNQITAYRKRVERRGPLARGSTKKINGPHDQHVYCGRELRDHHSDSTRLLSLDWTRRDGGWINDCDLCRSTAHHVANRWKMGRSIRSSQDDHLRIDRLDALDVRLLLLKFRHGSLHLARNRRCRCCTLDPAIFAYVADITTMDQRAKGNSYVSAAMSLGIVIGPGIGGFLAEYDLKLPLLVSAIVSGQPSYSAFCYFKKVKNTMRQRWHQMKGRCLRNWGHRLRNRTSYRSSLHSS